MMPPTQPMTRPPGLVFARLAAMLLLALGASAAFAQGQGPAAEEFARGFRANDPLAKALQGPMAGVEEIVFAARGLGGDGHWYANFGHHVGNENAMQYGPPGGYLCRLNLKTGKVTVLVADPQGGVRDPQVHYDAAKILFSYRKGGCRQYHLYEINADGTGLRQITDGPDDELEPIYLPDGDLLFCSSRVHRFVQCWFTEVAVMHRSDAAGRNLRLISANIEQDNTPWMMPDGRILYMRWEYVDRSRVQFHHLWTINPDGTGQMIWFGNMHSGTVMLDAKPIPGSDKVVASFSPGHGRKEHAGYVTVVSPDAGPDALSSARRITRDADWRDPWAFSEDCFIAARGRSLCVIDGEGSAASFYDLPPGIGPLEVHEPRPLVSRLREPIIPQHTDPSQATGRLILADVTHGRNMGGVRQGEIKKLLVMETLPKPVNFSGTMEPISLGGTFTLPRILGTVPVEPDGSANFELPALRPVFFVALDENGLSVKRMQSFVSVMPGETTSCSGCHENRTDTVRPRPNLMALSRPPSRIEPIPDVPQVMDFPRDIQPILDKHCVRCHDYEKFAGGVVLTGDRGPIYSHAYTTLMSSGQVSHGHDAVGNLPPRGIGSGASPLMKLVSGSHYEAKLTPHEVKTVRLWIESGGPYPGTYAALGTGMVKAEPDGEVLARRCAACHPSKDPKANKAGFKTNEDLLVNLTRPAKSLVLLAPLAKEAGGLGLCGVKSLRAAVAPPLFAAASDPDYQKLLAGIEKGRAHLETVKRFDMPGFRPNEHYVREMKRYGILPADMPTADLPDPYMIDAKYWKSFWYAPPGDVQRTAGLSQ